MSRLKPLSPQECVDTAMRFVDEQTGHGVPLRRALQNAAGRYHIDDWQKLEALHQAQAA